MGHVCKVGRFDNDEMLPGLLGLNDMAGLLVWMTFNRQTLGLFYGFKIH